MPRSLDQWLDYISGLHPLAWDLTLDRVATVAERLEVLQPAKTVVLVAGTNGKGSCCEAIAALADASGVSVGLTTSPHLHRYNERFRIRGQEASDVEIVESLEIIDAAREDISLSYFEFSCLTALRLFTNANLDLAILEVGLGGRLDAMNIVDPDIAVILPIALDHQNYLGTTREAIGREKAGIVRKNIPVVLADSEPPESVIAIASDLEANLLQIKDTFDYGDDECFWVREGQRYTQAISGQSRLPKASLAAALQTVALVTPPNREAVAGLNRLELKGRLTLRQFEETLIYLDVAHNPHAVEHLVTQLSLRGVSKIRAVFGVYADKEVDSMIAILKKRVRYWYLTAVDDPRAMPAQAILERLPPEERSRACLMSTVVEALKAALAQREADEAVLVFGSFPVVGEALEWLDGTATL